MRPAPENRPALTLVPRFDDEVEEQFRPLEWGLIRRLFGYTRPIRGKVWLLVLLTTVRSAQLPALGWVMALVIKGPITAGDLAALGLGVAGYGLLALVSDFMFHFRQRFALEVGERVVHGLRAEVYARLHEQTMGFFNRMKVGRMIGRITSDAEAVRTGMQDVMFVSVVQLGMMVFSAAVMAWSDWVLFLVVLAMAPVLWIINRHFRWKLSQRSRAAQESFSRVTATLAESVNGIRVTQGFVRQETNAGLFRNLLADHSRYSVALARTSALLTPLLELNSQFFVAVLLLIGGGRVFAGSMEIGELITFFLLANQFFSPIAVIGTQYNQALIAMAGAERIFRLIDAPRDWEDDPNAADLPDPRHPPEQGARSREQRTGGKEPGKGSSFPGPCPLPRAPAGAAGGGLRVEFCGVTFGYDPDRPVLHEVSFELPPGRSVALVGHTGSGKSSIVNLAAKFHLPGEGLILVDGHDIRSITSRSLHRQMGIVAQQNFLFSGSVLENVRVGRPEATVEEVREAARALGCLDVLEGLPAGFETDVGERGSALSLGQRQLVCFVRAMVADPRLLILDEATSAIDTLTESRLQQALAELLRGRSSMIVAHRLSTIRHADEVLVLEHGRIVERGTHAGLIAKGGSYAALHRQFVQVDE